MKALRIVILEFADGIRCDLMLATMGEGAAIADFAGRCLAADPPARLPLLRSHSAVAPADHVALLLNGGRSTEPEPFETRQPIPSAGLQHAMRAYGQRVISSATPEVIALAEADLKRFFAHYDVQIVFGDGRPDWMKTPEQAWTEK